MPILLVVSSFDYEHSLKVKFDDDSIFLESSLLYDKLNGNNVEIFTKPAMIKNSKAIEIYVDENLINMFLWRLSYISFDFGIDAIYSESQFKSDLEKDILVQ